MDQDNYVFENPEREGAGSEYDNSANVEETIYQMPFADPVYEVPYEPCQPPKTKKPKKQRSKKPVSTGILCLILAVAVALGSSVTTALVMNSHWQAQFENLTLTVNDKNAALQEQIDKVASRKDNIVRPNSTAAAAGSLTPGQVYEQNVDAVVSIKNRIQRTEFGRIVTYNSLGSGFIISEDGYVVSNYHVVEGGGTIEVTLSDGSVYEAALIGYDENNDVALLKMEAENLPYAVLGSSSDLKVGDQVALIGNPLGNLTFSMTVGYVSAKDRVIATDGSSINMIQTDAAINSGNSGGPLFNMYGEVVGITTAKFSGQSSSGATIEGIGFAIPMDDVIGMIEDLQNLGYISGAYLGVMTQDLSTAAIQSGYPAGAYLSEIIPGYAAEEAGLQAGDIIVELGGYDITSSSELTRILRKFEPDETVSITVYRGGQNLQLRITLDEKPREVVSSKDAIMMPGDEGFEEWYKEFIQDYFG